MSAAVVIHEADCPALCQLRSCVHFHELPHTKECGFGRDCPLGHAHICHAPTGAQLAELVEAAEKALAAAAKELETDTDEWTEWPEFGNLNAKLQPFRPQPTGGK